MNAECLPAFLASVFCSWGCCLWTRHETTIRTKMDISLFTWTNSAGLDLIFNSSACQGSLRWCACCYQRKSETATSQARRTTSAGHSAEEKSWEDIYIYMNHGWEMACHLQHHAKIIFETQFPVEQTGLKDSQYLRTYLKVASNLTLAQNMTLCQTIFQRVHVSHPLRSSKRWWFFDGFRMSWVSMSPEALIRLSRCPATMTWPMNSESLRPTRWDALRRLWSKSK